MILSTFAAVLSSHPGYAISVPNLRSEIETNRRPVVMPGQPAGEFVGTFATMPSE